jgi:hypothetical protein
MSEFLPDGRLYDDAVRENVADLVEQYERGEIEKPTLEMVRGVQHWASLGGAAHIAEAFYRFFELFGDEAA